MTYLIFTIFALSTTIQAINLTDQGELGSTGLQVETGDLFWEVGVAGELNYAITTSSGSNHTTELNFADPFSSDSNGVFDLSVFCDANAPQLYISAKLSGTASQIFKIDDVGPGSIKINTLDDTILRLTQPVSIDSNDYQQYDIIKYQVVTINDSKQATLEYDFNAFNDTQPSHELYLLNTSGDNTIYTTTNFNLLFNLNERNDIDSIANAPTYADVYESIYASKQTFPEIVVVGDPDSPLGYALFDDQDAYRLQIEITMIEQ